MDFMKQYGTESQCAEALLQARWPHPVFNAQAAIRQEMSIGFGNVNALNTRVSRRKSRSRKPTNNVRKPSKLG
jgi:hypothetical protein